MTLNVLAGSFMAMGADWSNSREQIQEFTYNKVKVI